MLTHSGIYRNLCKIANEILVPQVALSRFEVVNEPFGPRTLDVHLVGQGGKDPCYTHL